ncbi:MAG: ABC transporter permease [Gaiellales bacterium]|nr:MAG: ABC transporter permease [Gaiellales bacterium]
MPTVKGPDIIRDPSDIQVLSNLKQLVEYRELLRTLVSKDIRSRYKGSILGFAWNFAIPLLQLLVFWILFGIIVRVDPPGDYPFALFLFTGLLPWNFLANSMTSGSMSIVGNANLVKKIYFPLQVLPLTSVLSQFISLLLGMIVLGVVVLAFGVGLSQWLLLLLPVFVVQLVFTAGLAYLFACTNVFYRDVEHILGIVVMAWMYVTPILYPISYVLGKAAWADTAIHLNPMTGIITAYQAVILDHRAPDWPWFGYSAAVAAALFVIGFSLFNRYKTRFEEEV